uniref:DNA sliding clamp PCNA n=1 Tax=Ditylenchus dipsaci TaxID=166011 RepID=A0A915DTN4_9BILA
MFEAKLGQAALFKKIIDAVKDLVGEAPFDCTETAMSLQAMDASHVALVSLKLENGLFEKYRCDRTINLGLNVGDLSKILKCAKNEDTFLIRYADDESDNVVFTFEDPKCRKQDITMKLMDIDAEHLGIPDQKYACIIEMPSSEFQKTVRDIAMFSDALSITAAKSGVVFSGKGDSVTNTVTYSKNATADEDDKDRVFMEVKESVNLSFSIKYLNHFTKALLSVIAFASRCAIIVLNILQVYFIPLLVILICYGSILISISLKTRTTKNDGSCYSWNKNVPSNDKKKSTTGKNSLAPNKLVVNNYSCSVVKKSNGTVCDSTLRRTGGGDSFQRAKNRT